MRLRNDITLHRKTRGQRRAFPPLGSCTVAAWLSAAFCEPLRGEHIVAGAKSAHGDARVTWRAAGATSGLFSLRSGAQERRPAPRRTQALGARTDPDSRRSRGRERPRDSTGRPKGDGGSDAKCVFPNGRGGWLVRGLH